MRAFAYRFVMKRARSCKLIACPLVSRVACCTVLAASGGWGRGGRICSGTHPPEVVCKGRGEHIPARGPVLTGRLMQALLRHLAATKNRVPGTGRPCGPLPGRPRSLRPGWRRPLCARPAGGSRVVPPQSGHFLTLICHRPAGGLRGWHIVFGKAVNIGTRQSSMGACYEEQVD
jgi:hypothetical protein